MLNAKSENEKYVLANIMYIIGSLLIFGLLYLNYRKIFHTSYLIHVYLGLRNGIRLLDFENTRQFKSNEAWSIILVM